MKHWPVVLFIIATGFGAFNIIHEFFHLVGYFLETGNIGELHWFYVVTHGGHDITSVSGALGEALLSGFLLLYGNRWLKYYGFSVIILILVMWHGSLDFAWISDPVLAEAPIMVSIVMLTLALIKIVREADHGQGRTNKVHIQ